ncbi:MAG: HD domain-containing protein [Gemmatimonadota bacterium]
MSDQVQAAKFLTGLAQAISALSLYNEEHPAVQRSIDTAYEALFRLQESEPRPVLTFLGEEVVFQNRPLQTLRNWEWSSRLAEAGVERLEFTGPATRPEFEAFLIDVYRAMAGLGHPSAEARQMAATSIRWGPVGLRGGVDSTASESLATGRLRFSLREEAETVRWLHEELRDRGRLQMFEADTIVRSLAVAMHGDRDVVIPLLKLKDFDQYTTTHSLNVSVLSMALAEFIGLGAADVRRFGVSGLMHDIGKIRIPKDVLNKPGKLSDREREVMNRHPVEGAKILIQREASLDMAAVVAYEHHIRIDGGGYPRRTYVRDCHAASNLVHICDVYDALRTHRPYRAAWPNERVLAYLEEGAGSEFDAELTRAFVTMLRRWESRIVELRSETDVLRE